MPAKPVQVVVAPMAHMYDPMAQFQTPMIPGKHRHLSSYGNDRNSPLVIPDDSPPESEPSVAEPGSNLEPEKIAEIESIVEPDNIAEPASVVHECKCVGCKETKPRKHFVSKFKKNQNPDHLTDLCFECAIMREPPPEGTVIPEEWAPKVSCPSRRPRRDVEAVSTSFYADFRAYDVGHHQ